MCRLPTRVLVPAALAATVAGAAMTYLPDDAFVPPGEIERRRAIGVTSGLGDSLRRALEPDPAFFDPIPAPGPSDWLAAHPEPGQTWQEFVDSKPLRPDARRRTLYLLPLGSFEKGRKPDLDLLREHASVFFGLEVKVLPALSLDGLDITARRRHGRRQLLTGDVLGLLRKRLPRDAFALVAVTMEDLYPGPDWNFVFGQASLRARVGVYSFVRYDPAFHGEEPSGDGDRRFLLRSAKVLVHEVAHIFGLLHCVYFRCVVNGSNHLRESDSRPLRLCPVCLRKLASSSGFDVVERYRKLAAFYRRAGLGGEAEWAARRLRAIAPDLDNTEP